MRHILNVGLGIVWRAGEIHSVYDVLACPSDNQGSCTGNGRCSDNSSDFGGQEACQNNATKCTDNGGLAEACHANTTLCTDNGTSGGCHTNAATCTDNNTCHDNSPNCTDNATGCVNLAGATNCCDNSHCIR